MLTVIKDLVLTCGGIVGIYVALRGLNTWNRQLRGSSEYDLSRRVLRAVYRHRNALKNVRNPAIWVNEQPQPPEEEAKKMDSQQIHFYGVSGAYQKRWDRVVEVRTELQAELIEAEVLWGDTLNVLIDPINKLERELFITLTNYITIINPKTEPDTKQAYIEIRKWIGNSKAPFWRCGGGISSCGDGFDSCRGLDWVVTGFQRPVMALIQVVNEGSQPGCDRAMPGSSVTLAKSSAMSGDRGSFRAAVPSG